MTMTDRKSLARKRKSSIKTQSSRIRVVIVGLGNVGRRLMELLQRKHEILKARYNLQFVVVGVADSLGARVAKRGLSLAELIDIKLRGDSVGKSTLTAMEMLEEAEADLLIELTPTNLKSGEPGMSLIRTALERKMNVVTANKGPLVLAYQELMNRAAKGGVKILHSATVTGGLPTVNIGQRDLAPCEILGFEGVVNATTNYILTRMSEGDSFDAALKHAQEVGHAEADPSLDVDGWDAANKLVIIANAVMHRPTKLSDVQVVGIQGITQKRLREAKEAGQLIKLVAKAERVGKDFRFSVKPMHLALDHPLAQISADMMGVIYNTDINGTIMATIQERDPYPTAAAVLRDMIAVYR